MAGITRLGAYGGARGLYGSFAGKSEEAIVVIPDTPTQFGKKFYGGKPRETIKIFEIKQDEAELVTIIKLIMANFL